MRLLAPHGNKHPLKIANFDAYYPNFTCFIDIHEVVTNKVSDHVQGF